MAFVIGLMSGTSLDGCDAALVEIAGECVRLAAFITLPMPPVLRERILACCSVTRSDIALTCSLNAELGVWFAQAAQAVCEAANIPADDVLCIGSHGQTVYHIPNDEGGMRASTLQIGEPAVIAYQTGMTVVSSFRAMDMAAGGRGAPLVPYVEYLLFSSDKARALLNIGGIGNITGLPASCALDQVFAFDTGPGNMIIDALTRLFFNLAYDVNGDIAGSGKVDNALLAEWMAIPFIKAPPPKATGRELYGAQFVENALKRYPHVSPVDWIATATRYTVESIVYNIKAHVFTRCAAKELILSGGGCRNTLIRKEIAERLPECRVLTLEDIGWDSDAKEAVAFALLAYKTLQGQPGNVPGATGAHRPVILGSITPSPAKALIYPFNEPTVNPLTKKR